MITVATRRQRRHPGDNHWGYTRQPGSIGSCEPCGKYTYLSRKAARRNARRVHPDDPMSAYPCPHNPQHWHVGHLPPAIKDGRRTR